MARSLSDLLGIMTRLQKCGASLRSLTEPIDTGTPLGLFTFQILGAVAELERNIIRERSMAGQRAARDRGAKFGRPRSLDPDLEALLVSDWQSGFYTLDGVAMKYGVHPSTAKRAVYRVVKPGHSSLS